MRSPRRLAAMLTAVAAVVLSAQASLAVPPVPIGIPPESQTGAVGPYVIADFPLDTALTCSYTTLGAKLVKVVVKPPEVRWPDTNGDNPNQKGRIRHVVIVQRSTDGGTTWKKLGTSTVQTAVATETTPAPLTKRTVAVNVNGLTTKVRVLHRIQWIRGDGSVRGTIKHWYGFARRAAPEMTAYIDVAPCGNALA